MIANNGREITSVSIGRRTISAVYRGARLVWQALEDVWHGVTAWRSNEQW